MFAARPNAVRCVLATRNAASQSISSHSFEAGACFQGNRGCVTLPAHHQEPRRSVRVRSQASTESDSRALSIVKDLGRAYAQVSAPARYNIRYTSAVQVRTPCLDHVTIFECMRCSDLLSPSLCSYCIIRNCRMRNGSLHASFRACLPSHAASWDLSRHMVSRTKPSSNKT